MTRITLNDGTTMTLKPEIAEGWQIGDVIRYIDNTRPGRPNRTRISTITDIQP